MSSQYIWFFLQNQVNCLEMLRVCCITFLITEHLFVRRGLKCIALSTSHNFSECSQQLPEVTIILPIPQVRKLSKNEYCESQGHTLPNGRGQSLKDESSLLSATSQLIAAVESLRGCEQFLIPLILTFPICEMGKVLSPPSQNWADHVSCYKWTARTHIWHIESSIITQQPAKTETQIGNHYFLASAVFWRDFYVSRTVRRWLIHSWEIQLDEDGKQDVNNLCQASPLTTRSVLPMKRPFNTWGYLTSILLFIYYSDF